MLLEAGLSPGMRVLDMACGVGTVTCWMANIVGPTGSLVAADISPDQLAVARSTWEACEGLPPIEYVEASAYDTGMPPESFDMAYCRLLLCHLERPEDALREFHRLLKPGGVLVCHDLNIAGTFAFPACKAYTHSFKLAYAVGKALGVDYDFGLLLPAAVLDAGFNPPSVRLHSPVYLRGPAKRLWEWTFAEACLAIARSGIATEEELRTLLAEMQRTTQDETVMVGQYPLLGVWAVK